MEILSLLAAMRQTPHCEVYAPAGLPVIRAQHKLPDDVRAFYRECGGFTWPLYFQGMEWDSFSVLPPEEVVIANPVLCGISEEELKGKYNLGDDEISWDWYTIASDPDGDFYVIDLNPRRLGRCYDGDHETYPMRGETAILGVSFTDFLTRIVDRIESTRKECERHGTGWSWKAGGWGPMSLGDAYDEPGLTTGSS
jgi:hypothetical protein